MVLCFTHRTRTMACSMSLHRCSSGGMWTKALRAMFDSLTAMLRGRGPRSPDAPEQLVAQATVVADAGHRAHATSLLVEASAGFNALGRHRHAKAALRAAERMSSFEPGVTHRLALLHLSLGDLSSAAVSRRRTCGS